MSVSGTPPTLTFPQLLSKKNDGGGRDDLRERLPFVASLVLALLVVSIGVSWPNYSLVSSDPTQYASTHACPGESSYLRDRRRPKHTHTPPP